MQVRLTDLSSHIDLCNIHYLATFHLIVRYGSKQCFLIFTSILLITDMQNTETGNERKLKTYFVIFATVYIKILLRSSFFLPNEKNRLICTSLFCSEYHVMKYATTNDCFSINFQYSFPLCTLIDFQPCLKHLQK